MQFGGTNRLNPNNDYSAGRTYAGILFDSTAGAFTLTGNAITLNGGITNDSTSDQTINLGIGLTGTQTVSNPSGKGKIVVNGIISGNGDLTKDGGGTLTLGAANTFTGTTWLSNGVIILNDVNALQNSTLRHEGAKTLTFGVAGNNTYNIGNLTGNSASTSIAMGGNTLSIGANGGNQSYVGYLTGTGGSLTKVGIGTLTLSGTNTYTGVTTISAGTLALGAGGTLPSGTALALGSATLDAGTFANAVNTLDVTGAGTINLGGGTLAFTDSSAKTWGGGTGTLTLTGTFVSGTSLRFGTNGSGLTAGQLARISATGYGNFALNASGYLISVNNIWNGGAVSTDNWSNYGNWGGHFTVLNVLQFGGTSRLNPNNDYPANRAYAGILFDSTAGAFTLTGNAITLNGAITNNSTSDQTINLGMNLTGTQTVSNQSGRGKIVVNGIISGNGDLTKDGAGTLTLGAANTFTGTTWLENGEIILNDVNALQNSTLRHEGAKTLTFGVAGNNTYNIGNLKGTSSLTSINMGGNTLSIGANNENQSYLGYLSGTGGSLTKVGSGTLTLDGTNTYTGVTTISAGTLALRSGASLANTPVIRIAGGASYDVSAATAATLGAGTLGAGQALKASGSTTGGTLATAAGHGLTLNAVSPLGFTAFTPGGSGGAVPLTLSGAGTLTLGASSPVTVTVANGGTPLSAAGSPYKLIAKGASGTVATFPGGTLTVNGDGATGATSLALTNGELYLVVGSVGATQLVITTQPSSSTAAGTAFAQQPVVTLKDALGNVVNTGADATVSVTLTLTTGTGTLGGTVSMNAVDGVANFAGKGLNIDLVGTDKVLTATATVAAGTKTATTSPAFAITAGTATQVRVETAADGTGTVVPAQDVTAGTSLTVYAVSRDVYNNFVANPSATWSLQNPTGGVASADLTGGGASAVFTGHLTGSANIQAVAGPTGQSGLLTVVPGELHHFALSNITATQTVGTPFALPTITAQDANTNTVPGFTATVTFGGTAGITGASTPFSFGVLSGANVTPTVAGSNLTVTVTDGSGHDGSATIALVRTRYQSWIADFTSLSGDDTLPDADPDHDGYTNLQEYAFDTDPTKGSSGPPPITYAASVTSHGSPAFSYTGPTGTMVFGRRQDYLLAGLIYTVQYSADLSEWVPATAPPSDPLASDATIDAVSMPFPLIIQTQSGLKQAAFFRVGVAMAP